MVRFRAVGAGSGEARALRGMAAVHRELGEPGRAGDLARSALALLLKGGSPVIEAYCLAMLGSIEGIGYPPR